MQNEWKSLWNKRHGELDKMGEAADNRKIFLELKRSNGFDAVSYTHLTLPTNTC